ncbi:MAG: hypothetical protein OHM77_05915 [Candidatus Nitricoxidivorans perseverans]|uniref:Uncharacterized protein n=1 Tax=Candidatus Nitricoxidivorans perseverans TaxID=2975601 RepID=A0AA49FNH0_9PROT|nr:MAG: hypothetical protein OHM77_05915 [Candidatus Nitricoxidivorans perseverans]
MRNVWCVRAGFGTKALLHGSDIATGDSSAQFASLRSRDVVPKTLTPGELRVVSADHFQSEAV